MLKDTKQTVKIYIFLFFVCSFSGWAKKPAPNGVVHPAPIKRNLQTIPAITPLEYCQSFALQYAENFSHSYMQGSVNLREQKKFPPGDMVSAQYTCQFQILTQAGGYKDIYINIFLVEDYESASMITERDWQIIPISYIKESTDKELLAEGFGIFISHEKSPPASSAKEPRDLQKGGTPLEYCQKFAKAYAESLSFSLKVGSVAVAGESLKDKVTKWASNFFQPDGSKFIAGYKCSFRTTKGEKSKKSKVFSTYLFLVESYSFAKHTITTEELIPIEYIVDPVNKKEGYAVFKFLTAGPEDKKKSY